jgi:hypothetical protein
MAVLTLTLTAGPAVADEAYVCDAGRIVYVKPGELEHLKRTDPCIAGYYGLKIEEKAATAAGRGPATTQRATTERTDAAKGLALEREARAALVAETEKAEPSAVAAKQAASRPRVQTDYRNVLIINAEPGTIFRHDK